MIIDVEVYVPTLEHRYEFSLDDTSSVADAIHETAELVSSVERLEWSGEEGELTLCDVEHARTLPPRKTLAQCGVRTGQRLLLL